MLLVMVCMAVGLPESVQGDVIAPGSAATAATAATATTQAQHRLPQQLHFHTALSEEASTLANRTVGPCSRVLLMVPSSHSAVDQLRGRFRGKASRLYTLLQKQQEPALLPSNVDSLYGTASTGAEATAASALPGALYPIAASAAVSGALPPQPQQQQQQAPIQNKTQQHLQAPPPQITSRSNAANTTAAAAAAAARDPEDPTKRASWEAEPSYASHYSSTADRPNMCKVTYKQPAAVGTQPYIFSARGYVPYVGTSVVRDSQMLLARLYYRCACVPLLSLPFVIQRPLEDGSCPGRQCCSCRERANVCVCNNPPQLNICHWKSHPQLQQGASQVAEEFMQASDQRQYVALALVAVFGRLMPLSGCRQVQRDVWHAVLQYAGPRRAAPATVQSDTSRQGGWARLYYAVE
jgi:hypothetical protein